jgi:signal transduction histidine kinase
VLVVVTVALGWVLAVEIIAGSPGATGWWTDLLTGVVLIVAGGIAARVGPSPGAGLLVVASAATWFIGNLAAVDVAWIASAASQLRFIHRGFMAAATLAPARRPTHRLLSVGLLFATLSTSWMGAPLGIALWVIAVAAAALFVRGLRGVTLAPAILLATTMWVVAWRLHVAAVPPWNVTVYEVGMMATAVAVDVVVLAGRLDRRVGDAVIDIVAGPGRTVRRLVGDALGDAHADVAFAVDGGWVDELGRARGPLVAANGTSVIDVVIDGRIVAQVSCAAELASRPHVVAAVEQATSLVAENARLRAHTVAEAVELDASRRRLVVAAGEQRIRLSAELDAATGPLLSAIEEVLDELGRLEDREAADIVELSRQRVRLLRSDVHALASGLGPAQLADGDLGTALRSLVTTTDIPCSVTVDRFDLPSDVSTALYFVAAEAVSNAVKHAHAEHLWLALIDTRTGIRLEVGDDGVGGADAGRGSGLRGLADRVAAFGGVLQLRSERGEGTVVTVVVPITADGV